MCTVWGDEQKRNKSVLLIVKSCQSRLQDNNVLERGNRDVIKGARIKAGQRYTVEFIIQTSLIGGHQGILF